MNTWDLLEKELNFHGIELIGDKHCKCDIQGETKAVLIPKKIKLLRKEIGENLDLFSDVCNDLSKTVNNPCSPNDKAIDIRLERLFIYSVKDLIVFIDFLSDCGEGLDVFDNIKIQLCNMANLDICEIDEKLIKLLPDYKYSLDWIFRRNSFLSYVIGLLVFACHGKNKVNSRTVKTADRSISGPWSNLSLPLLERVFPWDGIEEEVRGRDKDLRTQRRYRQGLEAYNNDGRVGEGYFWREIRNEPFLWSDRAHSDPYPHRSILSNY
jgi:hypothetical protein